MTLLPIHIIAGLVGLIAGALALSVRKGAKLHCKSGMIFVYAMLVVSITGTVMGALLSEMAAVIPGMLTFYLVLTSWLTVRSPVVLKFSWIELSAMLIGLTVGIASISYGFVAKGQPTLLYIIFGAVALLGTFGGYAGVDTRNSGSTSYCKAFVAHVCCALSCRHFALYRSGTGVSGAAAQFRAIANPCAFGVGAHVLLAGACLVHAMVSPHLSTGSSQRFCFATCYASGRLAWRCNQICSNVVHYSNNGKNEVISEGHS